MSDEKQNGPERIRTVRNEAELTRLHVDKAAEVHEPTEDDEEAILRDAYGEPDEAGVYRWGGEGDGGFDPSGLTDSASGPADGEDA